jgi:hypothetical protein
MCDVNGPSCKGCRVPVAEPRYEAAGENTLHTFRHIHARHLPVLEVRVEELHLDIVKLVLEIVNRLLAHFLGPWEHRRHKHLLLALV